MQERMIAIRNKLGLHARPAALLVQTASRFKAKVKVMKDDQEVDGKSIMGLMTLAACSGCNLRVVTEGEDELDAIDALVRLIESGFGEQ